MYDLRWSQKAWKTAVAAGKAPEKERKKWAGQNDWDKDNMLTISTRLTIKDALRLKVYCKEAGITVYTLVNYMVRVWMAAWETERRDKK